MKKQFTLGKDERLKSRKQIEKLFAEGKSFVVNPFRIYFFVHEPSTMNHGLQFGVGVSNKNFKKAVDRNRIKRLTREAWRLQKNELKEMVKAQSEQLNVFFIYTGKQLPDFTTVKDKVAVALKKLADKINENISSHS
ncbi:MAG TPA: ribonuclease P protein component [Chitinophagaceae bacterium]|nr:ribonuclease P protein component [Chitinophagaceae bacterium]